jgi:RecA-family ATPase
MGETILLVGRPKVGKSRLVGQLALALASGRPFLGKAVNKVRRVLLLDLENRPAFIQRRFALMAQADEADKNIFVVAPESLSENTLNLNPPWRP